MDSKEFALVLLLINIAFVIATGYLLLAKKDLKTYIIPFVSTAFYFANNFLMLLHILIFHDFSVMRRFFPLQTIVMGITLNTVYIVTWLVGFYLGWNRNKKKSRHIIQHKNMENGASDNLLVHDRIQCKFMYFFLLLSIASKIYYLIKTPYYGWGQSAYAHGVEGLGTFSLLATFGSFLPSLIVTLFLFDGTKKGVSHKLSQIRLRVLLIVLIFAEVIIKQQRGRFFRPLLYIALGFAFKNDRKKFYLLLMLAVIGVVILSPIVDSFRQGREKGTIKEFIEVSSREYEEASQESSILKRISYDFSRNGTGGLTSGILYNVAQRSGFVGLTPYLSVPYTIIPTILLRKKHYPGSSDGTYYTAPNFVVGREIYFSDGVTVHVTGGGIGYWQLGWPGVILNGLFVGMFYAELLSLTLRKKNFFLWMVFFRMVDYGAHLNLSLDLILYYFFKKLFALSPIIVLYYIVIKTPIRSRNAQKEHN